MSDFGSPAPGKRKVEEGYSPDSPLHPTQRSLIRAHLENTSLGTDIVSLRARISQLEATLAAKTAENARLGKEHSEISRAWLDVVQGEDSVRKEVEEEKSKLKRSEREWMGKLKTAEEGRYAVQARLEALERDRERERGEAKKREELVQQQLQRSHQDLERANEVQAQVRALEDQLESKERELEDVRSLLSSSNGTTSSPSDHLRGELKRQSTLLATLEKTNVQLSRECQELRLRRDNVESLEQEVKTLAKRAKAAEDKAQIAMEQLDQSRRELDSLTMTEPPTSDDNTTLSISEALSLRHKYTTLSASHSQCSSQIAHLNAQNAELAHRLGEVSRESLTMMGELEERLVGAERECRWEHGRREAVERKLQVARKELEQLRTAGSHSSTSTHLGESGTGPGDSSARVKELEEQLAEYRGVIDAFQQEEAEMRDRIAADQGWVKKCDYEQAETQMRSLQAELAEAKETSSAQTSHISTLERHLADYELRVGSGEYNTRIWRAVEFSGNPAAKDYAIRKETLEKLRGENGALLTQIRELEGKFAAAGGAPAISAGSAGTVPRETYDRLKEEYEEKERGHAKRLQRLKEIFGMKSKEFLEAVFSLLGWRIKFDENGTDVRLQSMYAPKGKNGLTLKFSSQGGHFGTMQMMGAMAKGLGDVRVYWVEQRQSIPGFLAQVTLEMFEKTTFGRAAGYVPYDEAEE
ncbi:hypothetical protein QFC21_003246 [Naganishia friedmannii]|uniref:Uncharacterized protein n=1 Tax=Naganishia friedmannii TaxID=89922 RepID=A0ACC2VPJ8_9TREE|nr:hypothetical protein QFC21_003246 [Naganishia friedmannii]